MEYVILDVWEHLCFPSSKNWTFTPREIGALVQDILLVVPPGKLGKLVPQPKQI